MANKLIITGQIILVLVLLSLSVSATWTLSETWDCDGDLCVEGDRFSVTITIKNTDEYDFKIYKAYIVDKNGSIIASKIYPRLLLNVIPHKSKTFTMSGVLPAPSSGTKLEYKYKFWIKYDCYDCWPIYEETGFYSIQVFPKAEQECYTDSDCGSGKICKNGQCLPGCSSDLDCSEGYQCINSKCNKIVCDCGYISGHTCIKYKCCSDADCDTGEYCDDHECYFTECEDDDECYDDEKCEEYLCTGIKCGACEYISNHKCIKYDCCSDADCTNGYCENNKCIPYECTSDSDCLDAQTCSNYKCVSLTCGQCEYETQHKCVKYDCCSNDDCNANQYCDNHACSYLACNTMQTIKDHKCETNLPVAGGIVAAFVIVLALILFLSKKGGKEKPEKKEKKEKPEKK